MKFVFVVFGKTADRRADSMMREFAERINRYVPFGVEVVLSLKSTKNLTESQQRELECKQLKKHLRQGDHVVLLDERGTERRSVEFASWLERLMASGARRIVFVAGGPYGFAPQVYGMAQENVSLSRMTFSHQMVRLFFAEQVYRALTILKGEPYHHE